jgi:hypothetical protein
MTYVTYSLVPDPNRPHAIAADVDRLSDWVLSTGSALRDLWRDYRAFTREAARETPRSEEEYLIEGLLVGVLWRTRGHHARSARARERALLDDLMAERRAGMPKRRDGSPARLLVAQGALEEDPSPTLADFSHLLTWLLCTREYDDEVGRLAGWEEYLRRPGTDGECTLRRLVAFARAFERESNRQLERYTTKVDGFLSHAFAARPPREDTLQCSRPRLEYHFNILGAEILNRAWRDEFRRTEQQVLVMPGCTRATSRHACAALTHGVELRCGRCDSRCPAGKGTAMADRVGMASTLVLHGSGFGEVLRSIAARGRSVGIVGVACVPGLVGAGWRAKELGLPAQCVLLESSGCAHWRSRPTTSTFDFAAVERIKVNQKKSKVSLQGAERENCQL